jgi:hypothetical protein
MKKQLAVVLATTAMLGSAWGDVGGCGGGYSCVAPNLSGSGEAVKTTRWYTGLVWQLGGSSGLKPDWVLGVRHTTTKNTDRVRGADAHIRIGIDQSLSIDSLRLSALGGKPSALGQIGVGYSFQHASPLATVGLQASHLRLSSDYLYRPGQFQHFLELNTLDKPRKTGTGALSCANGELTEASAVNATGGQVGNGFTCVVPYSYD